MAESIQPTTTTTRVEDESPTVVVIESTSQLQHPVAVSESEPTSIVRLAQPSQPVRQKKSSFQITSVTVGSRLSNDGGEDSADDLDESHTEDLSSDVLDASKVTDYEYSSEEAFSSTAAAAGSAVTVENASRQSPVRQPVVSLFTEAVPHLPSGSGGSNVSVTVVESPNLPLSVVQHPEIQWQNRFRVVKIETSEPFRRGRWLCMDFLDPPPASYAQSELGESSSVGGSGGVGGGAGVGGVQYGNSGSGNSSGTGSMQHGDSLVMDSAIAASMPQHPTAFIRSADLNAISSDGTHGIEATQLYPMSIILQTQQQGNVDFTNTALHMQVRTTQSVHPQATGTEFHGGASSTVCNDYIQQQQQQQHAPNGAGVNVVQPPPTDYVAAHQQGIQLVRQVGESGHHHQQQQQQPIGANQAQSQTLVFQQVPSSQVQQQQQQVSAAAVNAPTAQPPSQTNVVHSQQQQQQQPSVVVPLIQGGPVPVVGATSDFGCSSEGQHVLQTQPPPQSNPSVGSDMVVTAGMQDGQITGNQSANQNGGGGGATSAPPTGTATGTTTIAPPPQETSLNAAPSDAEADGESSSGASTVAIDNKIEQAMDLVKSHLMFAVREEVDVLKERITELMDRIGQLEYENSVLRANATPETLAKLSQTPTPSAT